MTPRLEYGTAAPGAMKAMGGIEAYARNSGLEASLLELVRLRASQINGCAYCIDMHTKDALAAGESERRLYALATWRERPFYSERERAALAWTEAVTLIRQDQVPNAVYEQTRAQLSEKELVDLTMAVIAINGWNRLAIAFRSVPGTYQPAANRAESRTSPEAAPTTHEA
jgi:AhpD family alkylhydroperoxidase